MIAKRLKIPCLILAVMIMAVTLAFGAADKEKPTEQAKPCLDVPNEGERCRSDNDCSCNTFCSKSAVCQRDCSLDAECSPKCCSVRGKCILCGDQDLEPEQEKEPKPEPIPCASWGDCPKGYHCVESSFCARECVGDEDCEPFHPDWVCDKQNGHCRPPKGTFDDSKADRGPLNRVGQTCEAHNDCQKGLFCRNGLCNVGCRADSECPVEAPVCREGICE